jgi:molybdopterin molybdotransferase
MRSVQDQLAAVMAAVGPVAPLDVVLRDATGAVLAADVVAPRDVPAVPVAARDGYAVCAADTVGSSSGASSDPGSSGAVLPVVHDLGPGAVPGLRLVHGHAVRVASGAPMPWGSDAVVPLERTDRGTASVALDEAAVAGQWVRVEGSDVRGGDVVLPAGTRLGARQIALAAAMGMGRLRVHPTPRVVLLAVGDELVEPPSRPQNVTGAPVVYEADGHALESAVRDAGAVPVRIGIVPDDPAALREVMADQLVRADLLLVTGGLSEHGRDTVKDVLGALGNVRIDQVAMTPGGRHGFGTVGAELGRDRDVPVFALPGHPVAAQVAFEVFVRAALRQMAGHADVFRPSVAARVDAGWASPVGVRQFVPAAVVGTPDEGYRATPLGDPAAPGIADLARADALAVVQERDTAVRPGDVVHCMVLEG